MENGPCCRQCFLSLAGLARVSCDCIDYLRCCGGFIVYVKELLMFLLPSRDCHPRDVRFGCFNMQFLPAEQTHQSQHSIIDLLPPVSLALQSRLRKTGFPLSQTSHSILWV